MMSHYKQRLSPWNGQPVFIFFVDGSSEKEEKLLQISTSGTRSHGQTTPHGAGDCFQ